MSPVFTSLDTSKTVDKTNLDHLSYCRTITMFGESDGHTGKTTAVRKGIRMMGNNKGRLSPIKSRSESPLKPEPTKVVEPDRVSSDSSDKQPLETEFQLETHHTGTLKLIENQLSGPLPSINQSSLLEIQT